MDWYRTSFGLHGKTVYDDLGLTPPKIKVPATDSTNPLEEDSFYYPPLPSPLPRTISCKEAFAMHITESQVATISTPLFDTVIPPPCQFFFIDDLPMFHKIAERALKKFILEPSITATSIEAALDHLISNSSALPHVLICDINLGVGLKTGFDLIAEVRSRFPRLVVIAFTSESNISSRCIESGFDAYLPKSASIDEIQDFFIAFYRETFHLGTRDWPVPLSSPK